MCLSSVVNHNSTGTNYSVAGQLKTKKENEEKEMCRCVDRKQEKEEGGSGREHKSILVFTNQNLSLLEYIHTVQSESQTTHARTDKLNRL